MDCLQTQSPHGGLSSAYLRLRAEWKKEVAERKEREARKNGFASWEEYDDHLREEDRLMHEDFEKRLDEECARLGKTKEQYWAEHPQRESPRPEPCDCTGQFQYFNVEQGLMILQIRTHFSILLPQKTCGVSVNGFASVRTS